MPGQGDSLAPGGEEEEGPLEGVGEQESSGSDSRDLQVPVEAGGFLLHVFPNPQEVGGVETHPQSETPQCLHASPSLQDGDPVCHPFGLEAGILGSVLGSQGRLLTYPDAQVSLAVAPVSSQRSPIRVQGSPLRLISCAPHLHIGSEGGGRILEGEGVASLRLLRRLADSSSFPSAPSGGHPPSLRTRHSLRLCD